MRARSVLIVAMALVAGGVLAETRPEPSQTEVAAASLEDGKIAQADYHYSRGQSLASAGASDAAVKEIETAYRIYQTVLGSDAVQVGEAALALGRLYDERQDYESVDAMVGMALQVFDSTNHATVDQHVATRAFAATTLEKRGLRDAATEHCIAVARLFESQPENLPYPIVRVSPSYPPAALRAGITGNVELQYTVDAQGFVRDPTILNVVGSDEFRSAAIDALLQFRYAPKFTDGVPVSQHNVSHTITFDIID